jgi:hypothetical protein
MSISAPFGSEERMSGDRDQRSEVRTVVSSLTSDI